MFPAQPTPRLLLGSALLFWGAMTGRPIVGLLLAIIVEAANWTRLRWEFDDRAVNRAWQLSTIAIALASVLLWMDGDRHNLVPRLLAWLPALLLPVQFVQSYGLRQALPLNSFSLLGRQRRERNRRLGLPESIVHVHFGNVLFFLALACATIGTEANSFAFLPGLVALSGWALIASRAGRPPQIVAALLACGALALLGQTALQKASDWFNRGGRDHPSNQLDPNHYRTAIGNLGEIKQSPRIFWRLTQLQGNPPRLLRTATYNRYRRGVWDVNVPPPLDPEEDEFVDLDTFERVDGEAFFLTREDSFRERATRDGLARFSLRGAAVTNQTFPIPGNASALRDFPLDGIQRNSLGTVRIYPQRSVIDGAVLWGDPVDFERTPLSVEDLAVPDTEREAVLIAIAESGIADEPTLGLRMQRLAGFFQSEFRYSRYLTVPPFRIGSSESLTAVGTFLTEERQGHCEYFATAAAFMLRELGVPVRYSVGYAVAERDNARAEFVLRGTHFHAWCRVWDEDRGIWIDFDPTPAGWLAIEQQRGPGSRRFADALQRMREDFFIWRGKPDNRLRVGLAFAAVGLALLGYVAARLWKSRRRIEVAARSLRPGAPTPLNSLEASASRLLGPRPPGEPLGRWLRRLAEHLPQARTLDEAILLHQRLRFDPAPRDPVSIERLTEIAAELRSSLSRQTLTRRTHDRA